MFKNYLYLLRAIYEVKNLVINQKITEIYTQEKDKLFIALPLKDKALFHIIISTNPQLPYFTIKEIHHKAKKNTKNFFVEYLPDTIQNIEIAHDDRIIKFNLTKSCLFFTIRGPYTNVYLVDDNKNLLSFKKLKEDKEINIVEEFYSHKYINDYAILLNELNNETDEQILNTYKFFEKSLLNEYKIRNNSELKNIITDFFYKKIRVSIEPNEGLIKFEPESFYLPKNFISVNSFQNYFEALSEYFKLLYKLSERKKLYTEIQKYTKLEIERVTNKLNNIKAIIDNGSKEKYYINIGNLLLMNIYKLKKGMKGIELTDETGNSCKIELDEKLTPKQNIDRYFQKAKEEKIRYEKSQSLYNELLKDYEKLKEVMSKLENINDEELKKLKEELKIKSSINKEKDFQASRFRHYILDNKFHIYIGKDSQSNDELTLKFAKQNDYWFHVRGAKGSHVILRVENSKESIPKNIINKAASLAAFYSKAKTSNLVPVSYTQKKYVVKRKGMEPGEVSLLREEVILVKPEIPPSCQLYNE